MNPLTNHVRALIHRSIRRYDFKCQIVPNHLHTSESLIQPITTYIQFKGVSALRSNLGQTMGFEVLQRFGVALELQNPAISLRVLNLRISSQDSMNKCSYAIVAVEGWNDCTDVQPWEDLAMRAVSRIILNLVVLRLNVNRSLDRDSALFAGRLNRRGGKQAANF